MLLPLLAAVADKRLERLGGRARGIRLEDANLFVIVSRITLIGVLCNKEERIFQLS